MALSRAQMRRVDQREAADLLLVAPETLSEAQRLYEALTRAKLRLEQYHGRLGETDEASLQLERAITRRLTKLGERIRAAESRDRSPNRKQRDPARSSRQQPTRTRTRSRSRSRSGARRDERRPYRIPPLNQREYATLRWLADRGYDGGILKLAGVEEELPDGGVVLGALTEPEAWEFHDNVDQDLNAFLASSGSRTLNDKLFGLYERIV